MSELFNIYCDESCHLEHDSVATMVLGAVWCPADCRIEISKAIRDLKIRHSLPRHFELKWTKTFSRDDSISCGGRDAIF